MNILTDANAIHKCLKSMISRASTIEGAVAWASPGFDAFDLLLKHKHKIQKLVVGLHFHQTHPDFIQAFHSEKTVKFLMSTDGTFHPKVYFFKLPKDEWACVVGSANFTLAAMKNNQEISVLISSADPGADDFKKQVMSVISDWWRLAKKFDTSDLKFYRQQWQINRTRLKRAAGKFGPSSGSHFRSDGGAPAIKIKIVKKDWTKYFQAVEAEKHGNQYSLDSRLTVIEEIRKLFEKYDHFQDMPDDDRRKVAGLLDQGGINYRWFGSMTGAGSFFSAINKNAPGLSKALDMIPFQGDVTREEYLTYVEVFKRALSNGGHGIATATRLLAMKRPDLFVCLDSKNKRRLCEMFKIPQNVNYESYWDSIIERIRASSWWNSDIPEPDKERNVWKARTAFLDALSYQMARK